MISRALIKKLGRGIVRESLKNDWWKKLINIFLGDKLRIDCLN
jgi:hypothetical protein